MCSWDTFAIIAPFVLKQPITNITTINPTCYLPKTGRVNITISGLETPYYINFNGESRLNPFAATNLFSGLYNIIIYNNNNCPVDSLKKELLLVADASCDTLYVPSAFSPNGDGKNEILKPLGGTLVANAIFSVYNRYGTLLFTTNDPLKGWDGKFNATLQPAGTYVWQLQYSNSAGVTKLKKWHSCAN